MSSGPNIWGIGEDLIFDLFVGDPNTGLGLPGKVSVVTLTIEKRSNSLFWNGTAFVSATPVSLSMTEVDSTNSPGLYRYVVAAASNLVVEQYFVHANVSDSPTVEGDDYSTHIVKNTELQIYESEPSIR